MVYPAAVGALVLSDSLEGGLSYGIGRQISLRCFKYKCITAAGLCERSTENEGGFE